MKSDSSTLLRAILYTQTEAALLGYPDAAEHLEAAAQDVAGNMLQSRRTILSDDIFEVVEMLTMAKQTKENT